MTPTIHRVRNHWMPFLVVLLTVGIIVVFSLLIPALGKISAQARGGEQAKARQCEVAPITAKVFAGSEGVGWISAAELARFKRAFPQDCPPRPLR
jgi:hypothetical protein